ncbi:MAG: hypothetical protein AAF438_07035 [Pseudomonadota bacterium]
MRTELKILTTALGVGMLVLGGYAFFDSLPTKESSNESDHALPEISIPDDDVHSKADGSVASDIATSPNANSDKDVSLRDNLRFELFWRKNENKPKDKDAITDFDVPLLVSLAHDGDTYAARHLAIARSGCRQAPTTTGALEKEIFELRQTRSHGYSATEGDMRVTDPNEIERTVLVMRSAYEKCTALRNFLEGDDTNFMQLAADNGNPIAMIDFGNSIIGSAPELAHQYFVRSWNQGEPDALLALSNFERARYDRNAGSPDGLVDSVAYFVAYAVLNEVRLELMGADVSNFPPVHEDNLRANELLQSLLPDQRERALARSEEVVSTNNNCCLQAGF